VTQFPSTARDYLTKQQYATDANLAARQAIYRFQQPRRHVWNETLDLAGLRGDEAVLDVGCGNGSYLGALAQRQHGGVVVGVDLSPGMLAAAGTRSPRAHLVLGDAQTLPFADRSFDVVLAMHMLYHVPDRALGIRELRRAMRPDGVALVVTNSDQHLREIDEIVVAAAGRSLPSNRLTFTLESGEPELRATFANVARYDMASELVITEVEPIVSYVQSMRAFVSDDQLAPVLDNVRSRVAAKIAERGALRVRTAAGCFVCR
jgi:ubiquinone/menaquinone biosynthesis C-methylase UbiE